MKKDETFKRLYDTYFKRLQFHASRFINDEAEVEDVVSDVFVDLWNRMDVIDLDKGIVAYLYKAVSTRALNVLRHKNIAAVRIGTLEAINERRLEFMDKKTPYETVEAQEIKHGINEALSQLPDKCREVFVLSYVNGLKSKDIADAMGISVRTVEAHVYKALRLLRAQLKYLLTLALFFFRNRVSCFTGLYV